MHHIYTNLQFKTITMCLSINFELPAEGFLSYELTTTMCLSIYIELPAEGFLSYELKTLVSIGLSFCLINSFIQEGIFGGQQPSLSSSKSIVWWTEIQYIAFLTMPTYFAWVSSPNISSPNKEILYPPCPHTLWISSKNCTQSLDECIYNIHLQIPIWALQSPVLYLLSFLGDLLCIDASVID